MLVKAHQNAEKLLWMKTLLQVTLGCMASPEDQDLY